ncbi:molybdate ABC transporter substrate-binding protein [Thalassoglobus polymorphus]|uniref:molybdate ABC transporter substrate-binding protein n=1 Tax=Thalassoglobus polymorphus TaxID=2527994 RepID=UPI0018D240EE|nr:molybdate ABC transporter substrate-binding protein [Thalassoglobus polymorphus]
MNTLWVLLLGAIGLIAFLVLMLKQGPPKTNSGKQQLVMHCAAGLRVPVEEIVAEYEKEYGVVVELQFGGSNTLLNQLQVNHFSDADLYLAADDFYTDKAVELELAAETLPIAHQRPVVAVRKDSKKVIETIEDLLQDDMSIALGSPDQAAIGKAIRKQLEAIEIDGTNRWAQLEKLVTDKGVFKPTVNEIANDVKLGAVDAALVWDSTVMMPKYRDELKAIPLPELDSDPNLISIAVLNSTTDPTAALKFARYLTARDKGLTIFEKYGTRPVEGDVWAESPEISFFCGAVNRRAVEKLLDEFQAREGIRINTKYNGCGILTSEMKTIENQSTDQGFPDVYMACDRYYLDNVRDWFQDDIDVSDVELVIVVPKGSKSVSSLADLIKPGIRVALGQPEQCTIGALTRRMLESEGLYQKIKEKQATEGEVVVEKISSALLIPDVVAGHVDASIAYITDALPNTKDVDIIRVETTQNVAVQPFSIARSSDHKYLSRRLFKKIAEAEKDFESAGFNFRLDNGSQKQQPESDAL